MPAKRTLTLAEYETIRRLAATGARDKAIARALHVCPATWKRIRRRDPKALEASRAGRGELCTRLLPFIEMFEPLPGKY